MWMICQLVSRRRMFNAVARRLRRMSRNSVAMNTGKASKITGAASSKAMGKTNKAGRRMK